MQKAKQSRVRAVPTSAPQAMPQGPFQAVVTEVDAEGMIRVETDAGLALRCAWLQVSAVPVRLVAGDAVLVLPLPGEAPPVVLGRIAACTAEALAPATVDIRATQHIGLLCGAGRIDMRADGRVLVKGDDVVIHAQGTQRIRAGTVAIN